MEHRVRVNSKLYNLISVFENRIENGEPLRLEEEDSSMLLSYYEKARLYDKALEVLEINIEQYPFRAHLYIAKAKMQLRLNRYDECFNTLNVAASMSPCENQIHIIKAQVFAQKGNFTEAFKEIEQYQSSKNDVDLYLCRSYIYAKMRAFKEMYSTLKEALLIDSENDEALERFQFAVEKGKYFNEAIAFTKYLIDKNPYNYMAWYNLGLAQASIGEYEESIISLEYSYLIEPSFDSGYLECAEVCLQIGNFNKAVDIFTECVEVFGEEVDLLINLADSLIKVHKYDQALEILHKAAKYDPYCEEIYFLLGEVYAGKKQWYEAINFYHKAVKIDEDCEDFYFALAKCYLQVEEYNKATANFQMAISFGPEDTRYWKEFSILMIKLGLYNEAIHILNEADDFSYGADLLYCKSVAFLFLKDKSSAITLLEEALEEDFDGHKIIYQIDPELEIDSDIKAIVKYYSF